MSAPKFIKLVEPLTADNYFQWRNLQLAAFQLLDVLDHIQTAGGGVINPPADATLLPEWNKKDYLALGQIKFNITPSQLYNTGDQASPATAYVVWTALNKVYTNTSMAAKMALQNRLQTYTLAPGAAVQDHSNGLRELADRLKACNEPVSEANLCMRLLMSMPAEYADVVNQFKWTNTSTLQYATLLQSLLAKETELKAKEAEAERTMAAVRAHLAAASHVTALAAGGRPQKHTCPGCGKYSIHTVDQCWELHPELREAARQRRATKGKRQRSSAPDDDVQEARRSEPPRAQYAADTQYPQVGSQPLAHR
jgi:hypothetical protein